MSVFYAITVYDIFATLHPLQLMLLLDVLDVFRCFSQQTSSILNYHRPYSLRGCIVLAITNILQVADSQYSVNINGFTSKLCSSSDYVLSASSTKVFYGALTTVKSVVRTIIVKPLLILHYYILSFCISKE